MKKDIQWIKNANQQDIADIKNRSLGLMNEIIEKTTPEVFSIIDSLGKDSQKSMQKNNDFMEQNISSLLKDLDGNSPTAEKLMELSNCMDSLNPRSLRQSWWFSIVPAPVKKHFINNFIDKYIPMKEHVKKILDGLKYGYDEIININARMEGQYNDLVISMKDIQSDVYLCQDTIARLKLFQDTIDDSDEIAIKKFQQFENKLWRKFRDLQTKEQAINQFFISIEQSFVSNSLLSEQIESALTVGPMVINNALQIQSNLAKQAKIKEGLEKFQVGLGDMMAQNAKATKTATADIVSLYSNPVLALDKMEEGFNDLMAAVNTANQAISNSTKAAIDTSARLQDMNSALNPTINAMRDNRANDLI